MKKLTIVFFLISSLSSLWAQESKVTSDLLFWSGVGLKKEMNKWLELELEHEWRFEENASKLYRRQTSVGLEFDLPKGFKTGFIIRTKSNIIEDNIFKNKYSYLIDGKYKYKFHHFDISYRLRTEFNRDSLFEINKLGEDLEIRNRVKVDFEIEKFNIEPYLSYELFIEKKGSNSDFVSNNNRFTVGCEFKLSKYNKIDLFYRIDQELVQYFPYTNYCIGFTWQYEI